MAKISGCLSISVVAANTFLWPEELGGLGSHAELLHCLRSAVSCDDLFICIGLTASPCAPEARCDDNIAVICRSFVDGRALTQRVDCSSDSQNPTCSVAFDEKYGTGAFCHAGPCSSSHCDGDTVVRCRGGFEVRESCATSHRTCASNASGPFCSTGKPCTSTVCDGNTLSLCTTGQVSLELPCESVVPTTRCVGADGSAQCWSKNTFSSCGEDDDYTSWCEGTSAISCMSGVRFETDCSSVSGGTCEDYATGENGEAHSARCRLP